MALTGGPTVTLMFKGDTDQLRREIAGIGTMVAGVGATVGILGGVGAAASAAVLAVAAVPLAFAAIGVAAVAGSDRSKAAFTGLKDHVLASVRELAAPIQDELIRSINSVQAAYDRIAPVLGRLFELAAPQYCAFTSGILALVEDALPGFETAMRNSGPVVDAFARGLGTLGTGIGDFFAELSKGTPGAVVGLDALFGLTRDLLTWLGQLVAQLANALGPAFAAMTGPVMEIVRALGDFLMPIVQALAPFVGELAHTFADLLVPALRILTPLFVDLGTMIGGLVDDALRTIGPPILDLIRMLVDGLRPILPVISELFRALFPVIADLARTLTDALRPILPVIVDLFRSMAPVVTDLVRALADALKPVLPIITDAFVKMAPTLKEIGEKLGVLLVEAIHALAPLLVTLVQGALDFTPALLPVIPPLLEMAHNAMPLVAGVIKDVLIPIIKWLVTEFVGLIDYGVKIADRFAELSVRWRTYWDEIKAAFADAGAKITAGIEAFSALPETARKYWDQLYQAIKDKIAVIVTDIAAFPGKLLDAILAPIHKFYDAGAGIMQSFADGINSKADAAKDAAGNVVGGTDALFPQSRPRRGRSPARATRSTAGRR